MNKRTDQDQFDWAFRRLLGNPPYPWQKRLFDGLSTGGCFHALDIPTGLGKTSVIAIWLLAHLLGDEHHRPPMRLIYVVNRRTIVDQATSTAEHIAAVLEEDSELKERWNDRFGAGEMAISTLRGARADSGAWLLSPHRPTVVVGTVDMIGSRLLFGAYRAGRWQRSRHAGLIGQDALIVHDEAHLSGPFQQLLSWVQLRQFQGADGSPRPLRVMAMSATGSETGEVLRLNDQDLRCEQVMKRVQARKRLRIHQPPVKRDLPARLAELAVAHDDARARVIIFVRTPELARLVGKQLEQKWKVPSQAIALLTGTIRGHERDELVKTPVLKHLLESEKPERSEYLIATSAGEVGADFDADHMVCDSTTSDAMIQRLGRVNRRGDGDAQVDLVPDIIPSAKLSDFELRCVHAVEWLRTLPPLDGDALDASPDAVSKRREQSMHAYTSACRAEPEWVAPHDVTLDAWSLTSIQEDWPLAQERDRYLHGMQQADPPRVTFAWREELDELLRPETAESFQRQYPNFLQVHRLLLAEIVQAKVSDALDTLLALAAYRKQLDDDVRKHQPASRFAVLLRQSECRLVDLELQDVRELEDLLPGATVVLPTTAGRLDQHGMLDPSFSSPVLDVADIGIEQRRDRIVRRRDENGQLHERRLGQISANVHQQDDASFRQVLRLLIAGRDQETPAVLISRRPRAVLDQQELLLQDHVEQVLGESENISERLLPTQHASDFYTTANLHDLGKKRRLWQEAAGNDDPGCDVAKCVPGKTMNGRRLNGYRHEFGSLVEAPDGLSDLVLHLVASHHGRARPGFNLRALAHHDALPETLLPDEIARRFERLQRQYGHWGLAWLEACFMAADAAGSASPEEIEEESEESAP